MAIPQPQLFTIGHSTHSTREFINMLKSFRVQLLVDVRHYPGSRFCPQFGKARLRASLKRHGIDYLHMEELGGRRPPDRERTDNAGWRNAGFRGYADYMQSEEFKVALDQLMQMGRKQCVAIMCAEALPWRCHRSLIADALLVHKFKVEDIMGVAKSRKHAMTKFAQVSRKKITYPEEKLPKGS
jgi:uncharacterized protein (DUF488 family)